MSPDLRTSLWTLPTAREFVQKAGQALCCGNSLIILFPSNSDLPGFKDELIHYIQMDRYQSVEAIDFQDIYANGISTSPFELLQTTFRSMTEYNFLEQMVDDPCLPETILCTNLETCSKDIVQQWLNAIVRWSEASRSKGSVRSLAMLMKLNGSNDLQLPPRDIRLTYHIWYGVPSALETRLLCRINDDEMTAEGLWREFILSSIIGNDLALSSRLWEVVCEPVENIEALLCEYGKEQGWIPQEISRILSNWRPTSPCQQIRLSPGDLRFQLMSQGLIVSTPEYGEEIHSAAIALLQDKETILQRLWRAQASLILPLLDDLRRKVCEYMTRQYGDDWAYIENRNCQLPVELGELKVIFEDMSDKIKEKQQWKTGIIQAWRIRNCLAHYSPIPYHWFLDLWRLSGSVHHSIYQR